MKVCMVGGGKGIDKEVVAEVYMKTKLKQMGSVPIFHVMGKLDIEPCKILPIHVL